MKLGYVLIEHFYLSSMLPCFFFISLESVQTLLISIPDGQTGWDKNHSCNSNSWVNDDWARSRVLGFIHIMFITSSHPFPKFKSHLSFCHCLLPLDLLLLLSQPSSLQFLFSTSSCSSPHVISIPIILLFSPQLSFSRLQFLSSSPFLSPELIKKKVIVIDYLECGRTVRGSADSKMFLIILHFFTGEFRFQKSCIIWNSGEWMINLSTGLLGKMWTFSYWKPFSHCCFKPCSSNFQFHISQSSWYNSLDIFLFLLSPYQLSLDKLAESFPIVPICSIDQPYHFFPPFPLDLFPISSHLLDGVYPYHFITRDHSASLCPRPDTLPLSTWFHVCETQTARRSGDYVPFGPDTIRRLDHHHLFSRLSLWRPPRSACSLARFPLHFFYIYSSEQIKDFFFFFFFFSSSSRYCFLGSSWVLFGLANV